MEVRGGSGKKGKDPAECTVFLDRDGTINMDREGYLSDPGGLELIDGAARAIRRLNDEGLYVVVVTNQSGVARGYFTEGDLERVNTALVELLAAEGATIDALYYCPHHPDQGCDCRKPAPGLVELARRDFPAEPGCSYVVGDKASDVALARNSGAKAILVLTGDGPGEYERIKAEGGPQPDFVAPDLAGAVDWIVDDLRNGR